MFLKSTNNLCRNVERFTATLLLSYSNIQTGTYLSFVFVVIYDFFVIKCITLGGRGVGA
jgi:hypothetical protein